MADIEWTDVTAFAPALSTVDEAAQDDIIAWVNAAINPDTFDGDDGPIYRIARIYLAAHSALLARQGNSNGAGPVTLETAGGVTRQYANPGGGIALAALDSTGYGKLYKQLLASSNVRGPFVL